jgi:hypothetical protein
MVVGDFSPLKKKNKAVVPSENIDETHLLRLENTEYKYEIVLRKKALCQILNQVGDNFTLAKKAVDIGGEI